MPEQTPRETAELLLFGQWHTDWMVPFAEWLVTELEAIRAPAWIFDVANVNPSWLPILAVIFHADAYIAGIYNVEYERRTILEAAYINRFRGKPAAMDALAEGANFLWESSYIFDGVRVSGMDLYVTPSVGSDQSNADWQRYVTRVSNALLPLWVQVNMVFIAQQFGHTTRIAADYASLEWTIAADGGLVTTISLL